MAVTAKAQYIRISPRKVRLVLPLIKHKDARKALAILDNTDKKAARLVGEVLKSCIANAESLKMNVDSLVVTDARADGGPILKRIMPRSMGRADRVNKRTTHISVQLDTAPNVQ